MIKSNRYKIWNKTIAIVVVCLFLANQLAWAYPDALAPPTGLANPEVRQEIFDELSGGDSGSPVTLHPDLAKEKEGREAGGVAAFDFKGMPGETLYDFGKGELNVGALEKVIERAAQIAGRTPGGVPFNLRIIGDMRDFRRGRTLSAIVIFDFVRLPESNEDNFDLHARMHTAFNDALGDIVNGWRGCTLKLAPIPLRQLSGMHSAILNITEGSDALARTETLRSPLAIFHSRGPGFANVTLNINADPAFAHILAVPGEKYLSATPLHPEEAASNPEEYLRCEYYFGGDEGIYRQMFARFRDDPEAFKDDPERLARAAVLQERHVQLSRKELASLVARRCNEPVRPFYPQLAPEGDICEPMNYTLLTDTFSLIQSAPDFQGKGALIDLLRQLVSMGRVRYAENLPNSFRCQRMPDGKFYILVDRSLQWLFEGDSEYVRNLSSDAQRAIKIFLAAKLLHETAEILMESEPEVHWELGELDPKIPNTEAAAYRAELRFLALSPDFFRNFASLINQGGSSLLFGFYRDAFENMPAGIEAVPGLIEAWLNGGPQQTSIQLYLARLNYDISERDFFEQVVRLEGGIAAQSNISLAQLEQRTQRLLAHRDADTEGKAEPSPQPQVTHRQHLYDVHAQHFDPETGLAITPEGEQLALETCQRALNRFVDLVSQIKEAKGVRVNAEVVGFGGSLSFGKGRLGVLPLHITFEDVKKVTGRFQKQFIARAGLGRLAGHKLNPLRMPSDLDFRLKIDTQGKIGQRHKIDALTRCGQEIFDEFGVYIDARQFFFTSLVVKEDYRPIQEFIGNGLKQKFAQVAAEALPPTPDGPSGRETAYATRSLSRKPVPIGEPFWFHQMVLDEGHIHGYHERGEVEVVREGGSYNEEVELVRQFLKRNKLFMLVGIFEDLLSDSSEKGNIRMHPGVPAPQINILQTEGNPICEIPVGELGAIKRQQLIGGGYLSRDDTSLEIWGHASDRGLQLAELYKPGDEPGIHVRDTDATVRLMIFELMRYMAVTSSIIERVYEALYTEGIDVSLDDPFIEDINAQVDSHMIALIDPEVGFRMRPGTLLTNLRAQTGQERHIALAKKSKDDAGEEQAEVPDAIEATRDAPVPLLVEISNAAEVVRNARTLDELKDPERVLDRAKPHIKTSDPDRPAVDLLAAAIVRTERNIKSVERGKISWEEIEEVAGGGEYETRTVRANGTISWKEEPYSVGRYFAGESVILRPFVDDDWNSGFRVYCIGAEIAFYDAKRDHFQKTFEIRKVKSDRHFSWYEREYPLEMAFVGEDLVIVPLYGEDWETGFRAYWMGEEVATYNASRDKFEPIDIFGDGPLKSANSSPAIFANLTGKYQTLTEIKGDLDLQDKTIDRDLAILVEAEVVQREGIAAGLKDDNFRIHPNLGGERVGLVREYLNYFFAKTRGNVRTYTRGDGRARLATALNENFVQTKKITEKDALLTYDGDAKTTSDIVDLIEPGTEYTVYVNMKKLAEISNPEEAAKIRKELERWTLRLKIKRGITVNIEDAERDTDPTYKFRCEKRGKKIGETSINLKAHPTSLDRTNAIFNLGIAASTVPQDLEELKKKLKAKDKQIQALLELINRQYASLDIEPVRSELIKIDTMTPQRITEILHTNPITIVLPPVEKPDDLDRKFELYLQSEALKKHA